MSKKHHCNRYAKRIGAIAQLAELAKKEVLPERCAKNLIDISLIAQELTAEIQAKYL